MLPLVIYFGFSFATVQADTIPLKMPVYHSSVSTIHQQIQKGYLVEVTDSSVYLSSLTLPYGTGLKNTVPIASQDIAYLELVKKGNTGKKAAIGAALGTLLGVIIGLAAGDDPHVRPEDDFLGIQEALRLTAAEKALGFGILLGGTGALAGTLIGIISKKKFIINGNKEKFEAMKMSVLDMTYGESQH